MAEIVITLLSQQREIPYRRQGGVVVEIATPLFSQQREIPYRGQGGVGAEIPIPLLSQQGEIANSGQGVVVVEIPVSHFSDIWAVDLYEFAHHVEAKISNFCDFGVADYTIYKVGFLYRYEFFIYYFHCVNLCR